MPPYVQFNWLGFVVLGVHWPIPRIESPESVTVAEADCEVSAWLVAVTVTESVELRGGTVIFTEEVVFPPMTEII